MKLANASKTVRQKALSRQSPQKLAKIQRGIEHRQTLARNINALHEIGDLKTTVVKTIAVDGLLNNQPKTRLSTAIKLLPYITNKAQDQHERTTVTIDDIVCNNYTVTIQQPDQIAPEQVIPDQIADVTDTADITDVTDITDTAQPSLDTEQTL